MRHSINIIFGENFTQTIKDLKKYVLKYGECAHSPYFNIILWEQNPNGEIKLSRIESQVEHEDEIIAGLNDLYKIEFVDVKSFSSIKEKNAFVYYFNKLCVTLFEKKHNDEDSRLHFCLYIPLYEKNFWEQVQTTIIYLKALDQSVDIDIVGFASDFDSIIHFKETGQEKEQKVEERKMQTQRTILEIVQYRKIKTGHIDHFLVIQNKSLNLKKDLLVQMIGEFAMMCVENYRSVFGNTLSHSDLQTFGISVLNFDRYYFLQYLLHRAFLFAMEREGIHEKVVDINMAFNKAKEMVKDHTHLLSDFFQNELLPQLNKKLEEEQIVEDVIPLLDTLIKQLEYDCDNILKDNTLSIPSKRAILSALLNYDDGLFVNTAFDDDTMTFDDLYTEAMNIFIEANNSILSFNKEKTDNNEKFKQAILSKTDEIVVSPLNDMKKLRIEMQRRIGYIRELELQRSALETQIENISESKKCLIEGEFYIYGDNKFRLLPKIEEIPLKDDYVPHYVNAISVDLRENFPKIKNQGQQGSCAPHALTSIYEYILRTNKAEKADLSEAFLYYNARKKARQENQDIGSCYNLAVESLVEFGICEEMYMQYKENDFSTPPSQEAFDNALLRRVRKAVNVKRNLNDLKSALEDGYPIAITALLYDSFGNGTKGIVSLPTQEDLNSAQQEMNKNRCHAMVLCGFNDEKKLFIVRNSWGTDFGDNGYCYMPYSYITNENLTLFAAVITEIEVAEQYSVKIDKIKPIFYFDETDADISYGITNNLITEENLLLEQNIKDYKQLRLDFEKLKGQVKNPIIQSNLKNTTKERITTEIHAIEENSKKAEIEKDDDMDKYDRSTRNTFVILFLISVTIGALVFLSTYFLGWKVFNNLYLLGVIVATVSLIFLYLPYRKQKRKKLKLTHDDVLYLFAIQKAEKEKELNLTSLKMHISGHHFTKLFELQSRILTKYYAVSSLLDNLNKWYFEENEKIKLLNPDTQEPFFSLLENIKLDEYFNENRDSITEHIRLSESIIDFSKELRTKTITKENIDNYKKTIKEQCINKLKILLEGFNLCSLLINTKETCKFLNKVSVIEKMNKLDNSSKVLLSDYCKEEETIVQKYILINASNDYDTGLWENFFPKFISGHSISLSLLSPYKVIAIQIAETMIDRI